MISVPFYFLFTLLFLLIPTVNADTLKTVGAYACVGSDSSIINVSNFTFVFDKASNNVTYFVEGYSQEQVSVIGMFFLLFFSIFYWSFVFSLSISILLINIHIFVCSKIFIHICI